MASLIKPALGGVYRTRRGDHVSIVKVWPGNCFDEPFPFVGTNGEEYDHVGRCRINVDKHHTDLVAVVHSP